MKRCGYQRSCRSSYSPAIASKACATRAVASAVSGMEAAGGMGRARVYDGAAAYPPGLSIGRSACRSTH